MDASGWSTQQLAEFIAAVSAAEDEAAAALAAVERTAEALDADVAAIVHGGELVAAVGYAEGSAPVGELERVRPGVAGSRLDVPGVGPCPAVAAGLEHPSGATLVLARSTGLTREEVGLLHGIARVTAMTMRKLNVLHDERATREEVERLAQEQTALRRVATLVAKAATADEVFSAVAAGVGRVLAAADYAVVGRYDPDGTVEIVGSWSRAGNDLLFGRRLPLGGRNVTTLVLERNAPARVDHLVDPSALTTTMREVGARSSAGAPIAVAGRLWGVMIVASARDDALPPATEYRLAEFTELVATAIANAEAREQLRHVADGQAALRRVATLVAREASPTALFAAVAEEAGRLLPADLAYVGRYAGDGGVTFIGGWHANGDRPAVGTTIPLGGRNVCTLVFQTNRPARLDNYVEASGAQAQAAHEASVTSSVGVPITVGDRPWGLMITSSTSGNVLPPGTDKRLAEFTELVATAIANAEAREQLRRVADEQAALRRVATLVARAAPPAAVFAAVAEEVGRLLPIDVALVNRYDAGGTVTVVGAWSRASHPPVVDDQGELRGRNVSTLVFETGLPARVEEYGAADSSTTAAALKAGLRSAVGTPISVAGNLWGVMIAALTREGSLPAETEARLEAFTELVATAIANAEAQAQLAASRARIVATADETRRRIERDLHDGAQQRLVSLALQLRAAQATVPPELDSLAAELDLVAVGLIGAFDELREFARGIHPAILAEGGLGPALRTLARRSSVPVELDVWMQARWPERVEVAAYYVVSEALANAAKHANASAVHVGVKATRTVVSLTVEDDGVGGADPAHGSGLIGLRDRVEATGGSMRIHSRVGEGTRLVVELPLDGGPLPGPHY